MLYRVGEVVTTDDEHQHTHGLVVRAYGTPGDPLGEVLWPSGVRTTEDRYSDLLLEGEQCGAYTHLGPCTDLALPGDEHCERHGGCTPPVA